MQNEIIYLPMLLHGMSGTKDRGIKFNAETAREATRDDWTDLFDLNEKECWVALSPTEIQKVEMPAEDILEQGQKTTSQRLRAILYVFWAKNTSKSIDFDTYWKKWGEKQIEIIKEKINDE